MPLLRTPQSVFVVDPAVNGFRDLRQGHVFKNSGTQKRTIDPIFGDILQITTSQTCTIPRALFTAMPFSVGFWWKNNALANGEQIFRLENSGTTSEQHYMEVRSTGAARIDSGTAADGVSPATTATGVVTAGNWHFFTGVWASATSRAIYVDGGNKATNAGNRSPTGLDKTYIGNGMNGTSWFGFGVTYGRALSDAEVATLYDKAKRFTFLEEDHALWGSIDVAAAAGSDIPRLMDHYRRRRVS